MTDNTQFLFITHNKIAMEMAQQLNRRDDAGAGRLADRGGRHRRAVRLTAEAA